MWECSEGFWLNCFFHSQGSVQVQSLNSGLISHKKPYSHSSLSYCLCCSTTEHVCLWYDHLASMHCKEHLRNKKMKLHLKTWLKSLIKQGSCTQVFLWCSSFKIYLNLCYYCNLWWQVSHFWNTGLTVCYIVYNDYFVIWLCFYIVLYFHMQ